MHIHIGENPINDFKVTLAEGRDVTGDMRIKSVRLSLDAEQLTLVTLECYASIDATIDEGRLVIGKPQRVPIVDHFDNVRRIETAEV